MNFFRRRPPEPPAGHRITCPYCLRDVRQTGEKEACSDCGRVTPVAYARRHQDLRPLPIQAFGWSQHGKSVFLAALTMVLCRASVIWPGYTWQAADDETQDRIRRINGYFETGELPPPTPQGTDDCHLMLLRNVGRWGHRALVYRDCAGELFTSQAVPVDQVPFLLRAPTTFLIVSPDDLERERQSTIDMLMNNYLAALQNNGVTVEHGGRRLIVVLTKADLLLTDLPAALREHLRTDGLWEDLRQGREKPWSVTETNRYLKALEPVSDQVRSFIGSHAAGLTFLRLCREHRIETRFALISAAGGPAVESGGYLLDQWHPRRVLDPLLWALEAQAPAGPRFAPRTHRGPINQAFRPRP